MTLKLEAGKTYVFIDDEAKKAYLYGHSYNESIHNKHYQEGYHINKLDCKGQGRVDGRLVIGGDEIHFFKLKEGKPFDISEYEFSDGDLYNPRLFESDKLMVKHCGERVFISKQDVIAMAKSLGVKGEDL